MCVDRMLMRAVSQRDDASSQNYQSLMWSEIVLFTNIAPGYLHVDMKNIVPYFPGASGSLL